jgi:WhiB family redox-sensing transcriptional regulator
MVGPDPDVVERQLQAGGRRLDAAEVAHQVGVGRAYVAQTLAALRGGAMTTAERVEQLWRVVERDGGRHLDAADAARMLRLRQAQVRQLLGPLRSAHGQPVGRAEARPSPDGGRHAWLAQAACRDTDPELFFPERGHARQGQQARQVCAGCPVQQPCRDLAVTAASGRGEDHGIFRHPAGPAAAHQAGPGVSCPQPRRHPGPRAPRRSWPPGCAAPSRRPRWATGCSPS